MKSVDFLEVNLLDLTIGVLLLGRLKWVFFFVLRFLFLLLQGFNFFLVFNFFKNFVKFTCELLVSHIVDINLVLFVELWELLESHAIGLVTPIESFLWEFKSFLENESKCDIVVASLATNSSPEQKLLKVSFNRFIKQLLQCKLKLESMIKNTNGLAHCKDDMDGD